LNAVANRSRGRRRTDAFLAAERLHSASEAPAFSASRWLSEFPQSEYLAKAFGVDYIAWIDMTSAERRDVIMQHAARLGVPRGPR